MLEMAPRSQLTANQGGANDIYPPPLCKAPKINFFISKSRDIALPFIVLLSPGWMKACQHETSAC